MNDFQWSKQQAELAQKRLAESREFNRKADSAAKIASAIVWSVVIVALICAALIMYAHHGVH